MKSLAALFIATHLSVCAYAQAAPNYPERPVKLIVPFEAGGTVDTLGRVVASQLTRQSGITIFLDNKPGANGLIGTGEAAKAAPDGYTLLNVSPSLVLNPLMGKVTYDPFTSFEPVTALGVGAGYVLAVRPDLSVNTVPELVAFAKRSKEGITYGTPGVGNAIHIASEMFADKTHIKMLHVPFKGSNSAINALMGGQVDMMLLSPATVIPLAAAGKVKVLGFTGSERSKEFPSASTMKEAGIDDLVIKGTWVGWFAPAKTSPEVINRLQTEVAKALRNPQVAAALSDGGFEPDGRPPAEFKRFVRQESDRFAKVISHMHVPRE